MLDTGKVGELAAAFMDQVEAEHGADAELGDVLIAAEIEVGGEMTTETRCTSERPIVQRGLAHFALDTVVDGDKSGEE